MIHILTVRKQNSLNMSNLKLKCMRKLIGLFVFLAFAGIQICFSQTREVTGTVIDKHDKSPLPGVSVVVKSNPGAGCHGCQRKIFTESKRR